MVDSFASLLHSAARFHNHVSLCVHQTYSEGSNEETRGRTNQMVEEHHSYAVASVSSRDSLQCNKLSKRVCQNTHPSYELCIYLLLGVALVDQTYCKVFYCQTILGNDLSYFHRSYYGSLLL